MADDIYGIGAVTYIPNGAQINIGNDIYTFINDLVENKYGTVLMNGVLQDNSKIIYGEDYTIFGTTDKSCNAATLHKNILGTSYTGPTNPLDYNKELSYQYIPRNRSELASMVHDKSYNVVEAKGIVDALFNCTKPVVYADLRLVKQNISNIYYSPSYKDKLLSLATAAVFYRICSYKYPIYAGNALYNMVKDKIKELLNKY